ncbi:MAG: 5-oxopent-3-ene-1,2,5-tricarboxylate decarboxylase [Rhodospirillaceae bacterium TMED8]|nr:5-oxopent-3-ene-1,2,5-tricarboxylate decarboxylase [Magnetovibrio sp.]OUT51202.1 MAG: 5-oxopent-3-ene-1,2,5-tricarboxylate decarboxylase [Rhodospirillaceae bacterium TMED8]
MKLVSLLASDGPALGLVKDNGVVNLNTLLSKLPRTMKKLLQVSGSSPGEIIPKDVTGRTTRLDDIRLLPVIPDPGKIICIGRNYAAHAREGGAEPLDYPDIFMRGATSLTAHNSAIICPNCSTKLDYEAELVLVIGRNARHVSEANALNYVAGYSIFNEGSVRDYQRRATQWTPGKNFDRTGAFGPALVTPDELPKAMAGVRIQTRLNGETMQDANTNDLIFSIPRLIAILSEVMTLEPGDVVVTGTPEGVGHARRPPVWMKPGDHVEVEIDGLGILKNVIKAENTL